MASTSKHRKQKKRRRQVTFMKASFVASLGSLDGESSDAAGHRFIISFLSDPMI
jgi:hypothetical protein